MVYVCVVVTDDEHPRFHFRSLHDNRDLYTETLSLSVSLLSRGFFSNDIFFSFFFLILFRTWKYTWNTEWKGTCTSVTNILNS